MHYFPSGCTHYLWRRVQWEWGVLTKIAHLWGREGGSCHTPQPPGQCLGRWGRWCGELRTAQILEMYMVGMAGLGGACYLENSKAKWDCPGASQIRNEMCTGILCVVINRHGVYLSVWAWGKYMIISRKKKLWLGPFLSRTASWPTKWAQSFSQNLLLGFLPVSWIRPFILRHILLL